MDTLGELSEGSGSSGAEDEVPLPKAKKKRAAEPAPEELEQLGCAPRPARAVWPLFGIRAAAPRCARRRYKSGPSVLFVPEPKDAGPSSWEWCAPQLSESRWVGERRPLTHARGARRRGAGEAAKAAEPEEESREERERTRDAAGGGAEDAARLMRRAQQQALELREQAREEQRKLAHERRLTFKQKARAVCFVLK